MIFPSRPYASVGSPTRFWSFKTVSSLTVKYENSVYFIWYYGFYLYMREV